MRAPAGGALRPSSVQMSQLVKITLATLLALAIPSVVPAQDYVLSASSATGMNGDTVTVDVVLDNVQPIRGLTFGLAHDANVATLSLIDEGLATLATNGGSGADYVQVDTSAANGTGGLYGMVVSTAAPIEDLAVGTGQVIAQFTYQLVGAAGASSSLDFSSSLGAPALATVVSVGGVSFVPTQNSGSLQVEVPPVTGLSCTITDPCTCAATVSWNNTVAYDLLTVFVDGAPATTTTGSSASITLHSGAANNVCVVGTAFGVDSAQECCMISCPTQPPAQTPQSLNCAIDDVSCVAMLTWGNPQLYSAIDIAVDGVVVQNLAGAAIGATVNLAGAGTYEICVQAFGDCGSAAMPVCCMVSCAGPPPQFVRGDSNRDGNFDLSDPILTLGYLFLGATTTCVVAHDINDDGSVNAADAVAHLSWLFIAGPQPAAPFPACGDDPTADTLTCDSFGPCP